MVRLVLEDEGYEIRTAFDGNEALALFKEWLPNLVLLDIRMAGLSGWEILRRISDDPALRGVRVLVTSGASEEVSAERATLRKQGHDYIALPFDIDLLLEKVREMAGNP